MKQTATVIRLILPAVISLSGPAGLRGDGPDVRVHLTAGKTNLYLNEQTELRLAIDCRNATMGKTTDLIGMPDESEMVFGNLEELPARHDIDPAAISERRTFKWIVRPTVCGTIHLAPTARVTLLRSTGTAFGRKVTETTLDLPADPILFHVKPLPGEGKPPHFSGAVGMFTMEVNVEPSEAHVGDLITVQYKVNGAGWLPQDAAPSITGDSTHLKAYKLRLVSSSGNVRTFRQILVPRTALPTQTPVFVFSYFDPEQRNYKTLEHGPYPLSIRERTDSQQARGFESTLSDRARHVESRSDAVSEGLLWTGGAFIAGMIGAAILVMAVRFKTKGIAVVLSLASAMAVQILCIAMALRTSHVFAPDRGIALKTLALKLAPSETAMATSGVHSGATVRVVEDAGTWLMVQYDGRRGWIPETDLDRIEP